MEMDGVVKTDPVIMGIITKSSLLGITVTFLAMWALRIMVRHKRAIRIVIQTLPRDLKGTWRLLRTLKTVGFQQRRGKTVNDVFGEIVGTYPTKVCFQYNNTEWNFYEVWERSNQVANYFQAKGLKKGDLVALFMENRPEYVCIWLGLSKIGVVTCLINSNLRQIPLRHSFDIVNVRSIIYGEELSSAIEDVFQKELNSKSIVPLYSVASFKTTHTKESSNSSALAENSIQLETELAKCKKSAPVVQDKSVFSDNLFYMYTSGTTGLPKAAIVKHARYLIASATIHFLNGLKRDDVIYTCLPLYHTAAGICGVGQALLFGNTVVIRPKFSASKFWEDCIEQKVTVAQYIGEICRYLLAQPVSPQEKLHRIRLLMGNGLRPEIWNEFMERFRIPHITEMYGSTDGNCNMVNFDGRVGAVGFIPILLNKVVPMSLIKVDEVTGEVMRNPDTGLALKCQPGEPGELVGEIVENHPVREFKGYAGKDSSKLNEKKILRDVYRKGDLAFRTGDYLVMDEYGYFYFKDRWGDTFRWKGENVSTAEVETVISSICELKDCVVYGVKVPGTEGRAGMAAIADPDGSLDLDHLAESVVQALPIYARPLFLRVSRAIAITGTYKMKKFELQQEGFDLTRVKEPLYFFNGTKYVRLDESLMYQIIHAQMRI